MSVAAIRVWRMYLNGVTGVTVVRNHATLVHLLKQSKKELKKQAHFVEKTVIMLYAMIYHAILSFKTYNIAILKDASMNGMMNRMMNKNECI